jgi:hypothetical protein
MPQRRKQQKGAGLLDILSSDPVKKIEANNKRIGELEKESEQKCADIKKMNDQKIADLKKKNEVLQKEADKNKAEEAKNAESGSVFDRIKGFFGTEPEAKVDGAKPPAPPVNAAVPQAKPEGVDAAKLEGVDAAKLEGVDATKPDEVKPPLPPAKPDEVKPPLPPAKPDEAKPNGQGKAKYDRMFGGKKSKRRRGSKVRKSVKK